METLDNNRPQIQNASPELTAAMDLVAKNPNDPDAHLTLSLALWDAKEIRPAMDELAQAAELGRTKQQGFSAESRGEICSA